MAWLAALALVACDSGGDGVGVSGGSDVGDGVDSGGTMDDGTDGSVPGLPQDGPDTGDASAADAAPPSDGPFTLMPEDLQTIDVAVGSADPTVEFTAWQGGRQVSAAFSVDRGDAATIDGGPATNAVFRPTGALGGLVTVTAGYRGETVQRQVFIRLASDQSGATDGQQSQIPDGVPELTAGGGVGGVGGEGLGGEVSDAPTIAALDAPTSDGTAEGLQLLYPYDATVWPRGLRAPLLMWRWTPGDADAVRIELSTTSGSFQWSGTFGRPAILTQTGGAFVRHPIPQDVWDIATQTAGGRAANGDVDRLTVKLTVVQGGVAAGPITQTWTVAPALLSGTIYYNSYGTQLAKNYTGAVGGDGAFGGAVLSIRVGDDGPQLAAGQNGDASQCRVCHSVSADGSRLVASSNGSAYSYSLTNMGITETPMGSGASFPGMYPDGSFALTATGQILDMPDGPAPVAPTGLADVASQVGTPTFDPSGRMMAFNPTASSTLTDPRKKLIVMDFDSATRTFANSRVVVDRSADPAEHRPGWPAFLPDGNSLIFHQQFAAGVDGNAVGDLRTRKGARAQIHWTRAADGDAVTVLNAMNGLDENGTSYLPSLTTGVNLNCTGDGAQVGNIDTDHADDANLNYEPTVNPVASGGYAWVIFTSRRMYGNLATIPPFCSDPRGVDLFTNITPKKLWVAAIDIAAEPGSDASHPAFYLPSQELLAGNSRGFWVLDPCRPDGDSCDSGDQCCNGFCTTDASSGELQCGNMPPDTTCANEGDRCEVNGDCCNPDNLCIAGFCSLVPIQ